MNTLVEKFNAKKWYISKFKEFKNNLSERGEFSLNAIRQSAISRFRELDFPTIRQEDWKYTNVAPIFKRKFTLGEKVSGISPAIVDHYGFDDVCVNLVFINGRFDRELSDIDTRRDGIVTSLANAFCRKPQLVKNYLATLCNGNEIFTALNSAFLHDGAFIHIPRQTALEKPVHLLYVSDSQQPFFCHPRIVVIAEESSKVKIIESWRHLSGEASFTNQVSEIFVEDNATVEHIKIQDESKDSFRIATREVQLMRNSSYRAVDIDLGGSIVRNNLNVTLAGENGEASLHGFYFGQGKSLVDNHTLIDHVSTHCTSSELYKGILTGKSRGVFNGKVMVRPTAQKTNAFQSNQALLLSGEASVYTKPQLEIFADDVKCTHSATIGELDQEALFYLRSRGLDSQQANSILQHAFALTVLELLDPGAMREKIETMIMQRIDK